MKLKLILVMLCIGMTFKNAYAQNDLSALKFGDQVPDIEFKLLNHSSKSAKLSDFKGKVVILDFWATFCGPCIKKFPRLDSLQKENTDIVKIITIGEDKLEENPNKISDFLKRYLNKHKEFKLPVAFNDTIASEYFPHQQISHFVWIDKNGKLVATTDGDEMSTATIKKVYEGQQVDFDIKKDMMNFKPALPLFANDDNGSPEWNVKYKSKIVGYIPGLSSSSYLDQDKNGLASKLFRRNAALLRLFREAYQCFLPHSQIILNVKNEEQFIEGSAEKGWKKNNVYSYELLTVPTKKEKLYKLMQHDLYAYFGIRANIEKRKVKCYDIVKTAQKKTAKKKTAKKLRLRDADDFSSIGVIVHVLNNNGKIPAFDMTGINDDLTVVEIKEKDILNSDLLKKALNTQGLDIIETEKELEMLVISEVDE